MECTRKFGILFVAAFAALAFAAGADGGQRFGVYKRPKPGGPKFVAGEVLVKFKAGVGAAARAKAHARHGTKTIYTSPFAGFKRVRIPEGKNVAQVVAALRKDASVEYAVPNSICHAFLTPTDPYYSLQWHMDIPAGSENSAWHGANGGGINIELAWDTSQGEGVIVAVVDTGVAYEDYGDFKQAPDLAQTTFVQGYDFVNNDAHPNDDNSHGTHVAGTIAQRTNNGVGVAGVAFKCSIMPVKVLDADGSGTAQTVADGIYFAADNGAKVINMSLGWPFVRGKAYDPGSPVSDAVAYAYNKGVTIVVASGNDRKRAVAYPAAYDDYCIAVGATRYDETRAGYSNYGTSLDIVAPGGDNSVDQNGDGYADGVLQNTFNPNTRETSDFGYWFFSGTSMAAPHVAGVAALVIGNGVTGPDAVRQVLQSTAEDKGAAGWDKHYGHGIVDAAKALTGAAPPPPSNNPPTVVITSPADGSSFDSGATINFAATATDTEDGDLAASLAWTSDIDGDIGTGGSFGAVLSDGVHTITASVTDSGGKTGSHSVTVTVGTPPPTPALSVGVATDKAAYVNKEFVLIAVSVTAGADPVAGAAVHIAITTPKGRTLVADGITNADGEVTFRYKVNSKRDGVGTYIAVATASKNGYENGSSSTTFDVTK